VGVGVKGFSNRKFYVLLIKNTMAKSNIILIISGVVLVAAAVIAVVEFTKPATCSSSLCKDKKYVQNAVKTGAKCKSHTCKPSDAAQCCVMRGKCSAGGTCKQKDQTWDKTKTQLCSGSTCKPEECCKKEKLTLKLALKNAKSEVSGLKQGFDEVMQAIIKSTNTTDPSCANAFKGKNSKVEDDLMCVSKINVPDTIQKAAQDVKNAIGDKCPGAQTKLIEDMLRKMKDQNDGWKIGLAEDILKFKC
jgi:hypothetical protein